MVLALSNLPADLLRTTNLMPVQMIVRRWEYFARYVDGRRDVVSYYVLVVTDQSSSQVLLLYWRRNEVIVAFVYML